MNRRRLLGNSGYELDYAMTHGPVEKNGQSGSSHTFTGVGFGDAHTERMIVVLVTAATTIIGSEIQGGTIGGVTASYQSNVGASLQYSGIMWAKVPTGTSGTVVVTAPGVTTTDIGITVHRFNTAETDKLDGFGDYEYGTPNTQSNIECADGGIVFGVNSNGGTATCTHTWNGTDSVVYDTGSVGTAGSVRSRRSHTLTTENSTVRDMTYVANGGLQGGAATVSFAFS